MNPEDKKDSDTIFLVLSSWAALKDIKWGSAETLFKKGQCAPPAPLAYPKKWNRVKKPNLVKSQKLL